MGRVHHSSAVYTYKINYQLQLQLRLKTMYKIYICLQILVLKLEILLELLSGRKPFSYNQCLALVNLTKLNFRYRAYNVDVFLSSHSIAHFVQLCTLGWLLLLSSALLICKTNLIAREVTSWANDTFLRDNCSKHDIEKRHIDTLTNAEVSKRCVHFFIHKDTSNHNKVFLNHVAFDTKVDTKYFEFASGNFL